MPVTERHPGAKEAAFILIHGAPGDVSQMRPLVPELSERGQVALVDLPDSGAAPDLLSSNPDDVTRDVRAAVESLAPTPVTVIGFSFGAWVAARVGGSEPPRNLKRLGLIGGFARLTSEHAASYAALARALESGDLSVSDLGATLLDLFLPSGANAATRVHLEALFGRLSLQRALRLAQRAGACAQREFEVGRYAVPATVIHGRHDQAIPLRLGEELAAKGARSELRVLETDSHYLPWSHATDCVRAVLEGERS